MGSRRQLLIWTVAALAASLMLAGILRWQKHAPGRWDTFLVGNPDLGAELFFEKKGCGRCHAVNGYGGAQAPDLGLARLPQASLSQLVSAMWNCAPRMWEQMRAEKMRYPDLTQEEMAHLFAFLYASRYLDEPGDKERGHRLLATKGCVRCHAIQGIGGKEAGDLASVAGVDTPIMWTQTMWNHAPGMEAKMQEHGISWPTFEGRDMHDLLAYMREVSRWPRREQALFPASPERGWKVFQSKACIICHAVDGKGGQIGPELGSRREVPLSIVEFAALMWNHSPEMWRVPDAPNVPRPIFSGQEIADLVAFLASLRYFEPAGSVHVGQTIYSEQGCSRCHGPQAEGSRLGPALRGRGHSYTTVMLATALWSHGPEMYKRTREIGVPWPYLAESDIGHLLSFLNKFPERDY